MATESFYIWDDLGRPWRKAKPIAELEAWAKRNGIKVLGTIGNDDHLEASKPKDHTPFSFTAWPKPLPGYIVTAIDLANTNGLGQKLEDLARAGKLPWLKYMNHSGQHLDSRDLDGDGIRWEEYPSSDQHVHLSIRTDWIDRSIGTFDPFNVGADVELVTNIQTALRDAGFDPGPVDGEWGPRTQAAFVAALRAGGVAGPKGDPGEPGADGRTPTKVAITGDVIMYAEG